MCALSVLKGHPVSVRNMRITSRESNQPQTIRHHKTSSQRGCFYPGCVVQTPAYIRDFFNCFFPTTGRKPRVQAPRCLPMMCATWLSNIWKMLMFMFWMSNLQYVSRAGRFFNLSLNGEFHVNFKRDITIGEDLALCVRGGPGAVC